MSEERKQKETAGMHWEVAARQIATARATLDLGRDFNPERSQIYKELLELERRISNQAETLRREAYSLLGSSTRLENKIEKGGT